MLKYVSPVFLLAILIGSVVGDWSEIQAAIQTGGLLDFLKLIAGRIQKAVTSSLGAGLSIGFMVSLVVLFMVLIFLAGRRWRAEDRIKGIIQRPP